MTGVRTKIPPAMRLMVGVMFILLSVPSFWANALAWEFHGVDDRAVALGFAALGGWAAYDGICGLLRRSASK